MCTITVDDVRMDHRTHPLPQAHVQDSTFAMTRKVTLAPPPQAYAGFSSVTERGHVSRSYPNDEKRPSSVSVGVNRASGVRRPPARSTFSYHSSCLGANARPEESLKCKSDITPSTWRAGKELADRALGRERKPPLSYAYPSNSTAEFNHLETREHPPLPSHTDPPLSPSLSVHMPTMQINSPSPAKETNGNAAGMLVDLELSSEGEEQEEHKGADELHQPSLTSQVRQALLEGRAG